MSLSLSLCSSLPHEFSSCTDGELDALASLSCVSKRFGLSGHSGSRVLSVVEDLDNVFSVGIPPLPIGGIDSHLPV